MVKLCSLTLVFCLLTGMVSAAGQESEDNIGTFLQQDDLQTYQRLEEYTDYRLAGTGFDDFPLPDDVFNHSYRSPGRAFFYSLLVPGGGQYYSNSKTKAAIFLGVEAILWAGYFKFHSDGKTIEDEYVEYADKYWSPALYTNWLIEEVGIVNDTISWTENGRTQSFSHHLPETKTQQYYEMVGKYDQFQYGWTDTDYRRGDSLSTYRDAYLVKRDDSNSAFGKAKAAAIFSIANHLLSAFEAAFSAKRYNRQQDKFGEVRVKAQFAKYFDERIPKLTVSYNFY